MTERPSDHRDLPLPTAAELDILAVLWRLGPATVREVHDELGKDSGYTTTQKQMQLMLGKGLLISLLERLQPKPSTLYVYRPQKTQVPARFRLIFDALCEMLADCETDPRTSQSA